MATHMWLVRPLEPSFLAFRLQCSKMLLSSKETGMIYLTVRWDSDLQGERRHSTAFRASWADEVTSALLGR